MEDRTQRLIEKLKVLSERGVGGEKASAQKKLLKLLADNGLSLEDLQEEQPRYYLFSYAPYKLKLLNQIIYKVLGTEDFHTYKSRGTRNKIGTYCTPAQKIEIELDYEFYGNLFDEEMELLMSAFIAKQNIFPEDVPTTSINVNNLTPDELASWKKRAAFESAISKRVRSAGQIEDKLN